MIFNEKTLKINVQRHLKKGLKRTELRLSTIRMLAKEKANIKWKKNKLKIFK